MMLLGTRDRNSLTAASLEDAVHASSCIECIHPLRQVLFVCSTSKAHSSVTNELMDALTGRGSRPKRAFDVNIGIMLRADLRHSHLGAADM